MSMIWSSRERNQADVGCAGMTLKRLLSENQKLWYLARVPSRQEGRLAIVTKRGAGCDGRGGAVDERR